MNGVSDILHVDGITVLELVAGLTMRTAHDHAAAPGSCGATMRLTHMVQCGRASGVRTRTPRRDGCVLNTVIGESRKDHVVDIHRIPLRTLTGELTTLAQLHGRALLIVNVASKCVLTRQYRGLERLHQRYGERGFSVVGIPCNQFAGQEPGSAEEIQAFCSTSYGVTFPMMAKLDVNGPSRHPLYTELTVAEDADGVAGDVQWNFEKFLLSPSGAVVGRFRPTTAPDDVAVRTAIETVLSA